ncbi:MAG TPA: NAD(P)H-hydrate dehydratase [Candidatus Acidoferrum sp.]|nr:NAD(P)H-hydrate dehydratase [Candidatus Acidoferrum sp.]
MKALTAAEMREVDRLTTERFGISGTQLMENAGKSVADFVLHQISLRFQSPVRSAVVLCGKGNNGGDGFVAARYLRQEIRHTLVLLFSSPPELKGDAALNFQRWRESGGETLVIENEEALRSAWPGIAAADVILDALLGTGLRGTATGLIAKAISDLNSLSRNATSASPALIVAVDTPSGMASDGEPSEGTVLRAHHTVTFTAPKISQLTSNQASCCGSLNVRAIGTPPTLIDELGKGHMRCAGPDEFAELPLIRPVDSNKGFYGHILVIAGSAGKSGAAVLAGTGALKAGAGLVTIATPDVVQSIVASKQPEYMTEPLPTLADGSIAIENLADAAFAKIVKGKTVLAVGPGLGQEPGTQKFIRTLVQSTTLPAILDADGANAFASNGDALRERKSQFLAITPHPGEMARLLGITTKEVQNDRVRIAADAAKNWNAYVLLKGFHTILASPDGEIFVNLTGNPGLAKGGSGDVLTGILAALTGQFGTQDWLRVLALGAWLHGRAADTLIEDADPSGILASDVARALPYARFELLEEIRRGG